MILKKKQTSYLFRNTSRQTTNTQQASSVVVVKLRKIILNRWFNVDNFITALGTNC